MPFAPPRSNGPEVKLTDTWSATPTCGVRRPHFEGRQPRSVGLTADEPACHQSKPPRVRPTTAEARLRCRRGDRITTTTSGNDTELFRGLARCASKPNFSNAQEDRTDVQNCWHERATTEETRAGLKSCSTSVCGKPREFLVPPKADRSVETCAL